MKEENVILVNEQDIQIGIMPKMEAHEKAVLHRAFSVFVQNAQGEIMLQQRAAHKYHSPLLWTNTCCSHQREGESNLEAGKRRLREEMGFSVDLKELFSFIYKAPFDNGLTEHEFDHVMIGYYNGLPKINPDEVASWKWMKPEGIKKDISQHPENYTAWFKIIFDKFYNHIFQKKDGYAG
ncbi:isopentenyl-diphosphate Delta-isomerase [Arenibacter sp. GZD96]|uniref:isopentenyl-diphosphate Delta-isomerase n=1 Tax=Aurantibrevibacter litoralis TaxID=3106030 RepID=UPI002AFE9FA7|nr:isopentenyl-diphosphate Delta-isomerase [Arenibacter sp. GZD-96]MEA1787525.1 isopentenyl-diphosphate Delta-isomerase [Arenibacter sp. GZD-96]